MKRSIGAVTRVVATQPFVLQSELDGPLGGKAKQKFLFKYGKRSLLRKSERRKATKKNIENQCFFSSSLLRKSERRKE